MLTDRVHRHCAAVAASARHVRSDPGTVEAGGVSGLDPSPHFLWNRGAQGGRPHVTRTVYS